MKDMDENYQAVMRRSGRVLRTAVATLVLGVTSAAAQFEGTVESKNITTDESGQPQEFVMTMWIKKDRIRVQTSAFGTTPGSTMIYRRDRKIIWMLNEDAKTYFEMLQEEPKQQGTQSPEAPTPQQPGLKKTGKTRRILGYSAEQFIVRDTEQETEIWGTRQLGDLAAAITAVIGTEQHGGGWMDELSGLGVFPLAAATRIQGKVIESQEITRIERRSLPMDLFELPAGFRKQEIGEGLEGPSPR